MMIKQIKTIRQNTMLLLAASLLLVAVVASVATMKAMALKQSNNDTNTQTAAPRPLLTEAPTPSVTSSITNGVYMQDPKTKQFRRVSPEKGISNRSGTAAVSLSGNASVGNQAAQRSLLGLSLFVDPLLNQQGRQAQIASQPTGLWFGGWNADVRGDVSRVVAAASQKGTAPTLVAYNIPARDCGSYSAGGANSSGAYREWIQAFASGIGTARAVVVLEPDALPGLECLSADGQRQRLDDIAFAVSTLAKTGAIIYLDAGNYTWQSVSVMAQRLKSANIAAARGFSLNVSGYGWTDKSIAYGQQLSKAVGGGKGFVIDTSRNGNGPAPGNEWCNPRGRGLGKSPSTNTGTVGLDAYLWVKVPGESDGTCNGGPSAGEWWDDMANELIRNAR